MRTETIKIYRFEELNDKAKEQAIEESRLINVQYEWWDGIYDMYKCDTKGSDIHNIYFSGFYSQGDGAMFEASINNDILDLIEAPYNNELYRRDFYNNANAI